MPWRRRSERDSAGQKNRRRRRSQPQGASSGLRWSRVRVMMAVAAVTAAALVVRVHVAQEGERDHNVAKRERQALEPVCATVGQDEHGAKGAYHEDDGLEWPHVERERLAHAPCENDAEREAEKRDLRRGVGIINRSRAAWGGWEAGRGGRGFDREVARLRGRSDSDAEGEVHLIFKREEHGGGVL